MDSKLPAFLRELERLGNGNDAQPQDRSHKMLNITPDTGEFLFLLIRALEAKRALEIGTSNGYSTLWLARAVQPFGGTVTTLEVSPHKAEMARSNFGRAELQEWIELKVVDACVFIKQQGQDAFDFVFLDSDRKEYISWWRDLQRVLVKGGLLVIDNAISHANEMEDFVRAIRQTQGCIAVLVPVGKGELVVLKEA